MRINIAYRILYSFFFTDRFSFEIRLNDDVTRFKGNVIFPGNFYFRHS